ncbi:MAG: HIT family protein [Chloroflexota bacterium]
MASDENCIFCKIIAGQIPVAKVYEDEEVLAFMNLQQIQPGHTLVIPKVHYANIYEITDEALVQVTKVAARIARAAKQAFDASGIQLLQNNGSVAWQSVWHLHQHVIPRYEGDVGHDLYAIWTRGTIATPEELEANAAKLREALARL